jgi:hypothetical protein
MTTTDAPTGRREQGIFGGYTEEPLPLRAYALLLGAFAGLAGTFLIGVRRGGRELPQRVPVGDIALMGAATYKATRLLSKDLVTSPLRAPFVQLEEVTGPKKVKESARGSGLRQAVGELLICPYCLGAWVAAGFVAGYVVAPRPTRLLASMLTVHGISDQLNIRL